ncbi:MAG TPA: Druantia anti-phage system protein DruA [Gemmatimonadaceae bacterium]|nr:Druantia anti-phage system protein DruA [Gemmatimonadaceae bacterium]
MERRRLHCGEWHSIFSLLRDGRDLAAKLAGAATAPSDTDRLRMLKDATDPYIQFVRAGERCEFTGLELSDIWRYFRHTWLTTYQSTPGRKMFILIRDRAASNHPVVGIAALGSPIMQLGVRDSWIGWTAKQLVDIIRDKPTAQWARWLQGSQEELLGGIYIADFVREGHVKRAELGSPAPGLIERLRALSAKEREIHHLYPARKQHKTASRPGATRWREQACTHLFRSKRAAALGELLQARLDLRAAHGRLFSARKWKQSVMSAAVARAIATTLRYTKAAHVGVDMMDITVCGAIAPYNRVLGGKLVSLLMASPEIRDEYAKRYGRAESVIASSIAGRAVIRRPQLVLLGTTSLFGVGGSQYNRLRLDAAHFGGEPGAVLGYEMLGRTIGYGSYHFSQATMDSLEPLLAQLQGGRRVNSIFGEGVNPKLRKVRGALDAIGLPSDALLQHGSPRLVYGVALAKNFREVLFGLDRRPKYLLRAGPSTTGAIADFWRVRWLAKRVLLPEVIADVQSHTLAYPVRHGARVILPGDEEHPPLLAELFGGLSAELPSADSDGPTSRPDLLEPQVFAAITNRTGPRPCDSNGSPRRGP